MRSVRLIPLAVLIAASGPSVGIARAHPPRPPSIQGAGSEPAAARLAPVVVINLTGDLGVGRLVVRLREELAAAAEARAALVILAIDGRRWREDVARGLADVVKASPVPVAAFLPKGSVGGGQVLVALSAATCWCTAGTTIESHPGDEILIAGAAGAALVPAPTDAVELIGRRNLPTDLAAVLLHPAAAMHVTWEGAERAVTLHDGPAPSSNRDAVNLVVPDRAGWRSELSPEVARRIGIVTGTCGDTGQIIRALSVRASSVTRRVVTEDLAKRRTLLTATLTNARTLTSQALDKVSGSVRGDDPADLDKRRKNGHAAIATIKKAAEALAQAEQTAKEFPELLVEPPPGTSGVGMTPEASVKAWLAAFKDAQNDLARAGERAARAAETNR